jgi:hypothetical protein
MAEDYLDRLDAAARVLPDQDRDDLVAELRGHLATGLNEAASDADVRNMLADLGSPHDIVAAAAAQGEASTRATTSPWGGLEILAVLGLTVGTFVVPVVGPIAGLALAWTSTRWSRREKIVASVLTFLPLIALALGAAVLTVSGPSRSVHVSPTPRDAMGVLQ